MLDFLQSDEAKKARTGDHTLAPSTVSLGDDEEDVDDEDFIVGEDK